MRKNNLEKTTKIISRTSILLSMIIYAILVNALTAFAVETTNISPEIKLRTTYSPPSRILLDKTYGYRTGEPGGAVIKVGVSILPASFFIRGTDTFLIDQAKDRVAIYGAAGKFVSSMSYLQGSYDNFTPSEIYVNKSSDRVILADHLVTLKIREINASGDLINETLIDPIFALYPLGITKVSVGEDYVDVQTSDGAIHPIITEGDDIYMMGQMPAVLPMFRQLTKEGGLGFDYKKTGDSSLSVTVFRKDTVRDINISIPEMINSILDVEEVNTGVYAATLLLGREATPPDYDNSKDEIAVVYFNSVGKYLGSRQLPYVNQTDSAFRTIRNIGSKTYQMLITDERVVIALYQ